MFYYIHHTASFQHNTGIQRCVRSIANALIGAGIPLRPVMWNRKDAEFGPAPNTVLPHLARWNGPSLTDWTLDDERNHWTDQWLLIVELIAGDFQPLPQQLRASADRIGLKVAWVFHDAIRLDGLIFMAMKLKRLPVVIIDTCAAYHCLSECLRTR